MGRHFINMQACKKTHRHVTYTQIRVGFIPCQLMNRINLLIKGDPLKSGFKIEIKSQTYIKSNVQITCDNNHIIFLLF